MLEVRASSLLVSAVERLARQEEVVALEAVAGRQASRRQFPPPPGEAPVWQDSASRLPATSHCNLVLQVLHR